MILGLFGWRFYLGGLRWHHGRTGMHWFRDGIRRDLCLTGLGLLLMLDDLADCPWRLVRETS